MESGGQHRNRRRRTNLPRITSVAEEMRRSVAGRTDTDLHICPRCESELVQPVQWAALDMRRWRVDLSCPECRWSGGGVYPQAVLDRFDEVLDDGVAMLASDLERLERANMEEDVNRFLDALHADRVLPEDF